MDRSGKTENVVSCKDLLLQVCDCVSVSPVELAGDTTTYIGLALAGLGLLVSVAGLGQKVNRMSSSVHPPPTQPSSAFEICEKRKTVLYCVL